MAIDPNNPFADLPDNQNDPFADLPDAQQGESGIMPALGAGIDKMQEIGYRAVKGFTDVGVPQEEQTNALGRAIGQGGALSRWADEGIARNIEEQKAYTPSVASYKDIDSIGDAASYVGEMTAQSVPMMATALNPAGLFAMGGGLSNEAYEAQPEDNKQPWRATASGFGQAGLERLGVETAIGRVFGGEGKQFAKRVGQSMLGEGVTETGQEALAQWGSGKSLDELENLDEAFVGGALVGGTIRTGTEAGKAAYDKYRGERPELSDIEETDLTQSAANTESVIPDPFADIGPAQDQAVTGNEIEIIPGETAGDSQPNWQFGQNDMPYRGQVTPYVYDGEYEQYRETPNSVPVGAALEAPIIDGEFERPRGLPNRADTIIGEDGRPMQQAQEFADSVGQASNRALPFDDVIYAEDKRDIQVKRNGEPFGGRRAAELTKEFRQAKEQGLNPQVIRVNGGYGWVTDGEQQVTAPENVAQQTQPTITTKPAQKRDVPKKSNRTKVYTPNGRELEVEYAIVDADQLVTSNTDDGRVNPDYPQTLQPRDRTRASSEIQINSIANNLNPALLGESATTGDGAPIISDSGIVESGNGRSLALKRAYQNGKADKYRSALIEQGYDVSGFEKPVLARIRRTEMNDQDLVDYTKESNERSTLSLSASETAKADAKAIGNIIADFKGGDVSAAGNRDFVRKFMQGAVSQSEQASMIDSQGMLSQDGRRRVEAAMIANAYENTELVNDLFESSDNDIKSIGGALLDASGDWAKMRAAKKAGATQDDVDITTNVIDAVNLVRRSRAEGKKLSEMVSQTDLFAGDIDPTTKVVLGIFYGGENFTKPRSRQRVKEALSRYAELASNTTGGDDLFGGELETVKPEQLLGKANEANEQTDQQAEAQTSLLDQNPEPIGQGGAGGRGEGQRPAASGNGQASAESEVKALRAESSEENEAISQSVRKGDILTDGDEEVRVVGVLRKSSGKVKAYIVEDKDGANFTLEDSALFQPYEAENAVSGKRETVDGWGLIKDEKEVSRIQEKELSSINRRYREGRTYDKKHKVVNLQKEYGLEGQTEIVEVNGRYALRVKESSSNQEKEGSFISPEIQRKTDEANRKGILSRIKYLKNDADLDREVKNVKEDNTSSVDLIREVESAVKARKAELTSPPAETKKETHGVSVTVPTISKDVEEAYNRTTHLGRGRDFNAELNSAADDILNELNEKGLLDTPERKAKAKELTENYLNEQAQFTRRESIRSQNNPSWIVSGRDNLDTDKYNKRAAKNNKAFTTEVDKLDRMRKRIASSVEAVMNDAQRKQKAQKEADSKKAKDRNEFTRLAGTIAADIADGRNELAKETRKFANKKMETILDGMSEADSKELVQSVDKALSKMGGLTSVVGARSNLAKRIKPILDGAQEKPKETAAPKQEDNKPVHEKREAFWDRYRKADESLTVDDAKSVMNDIIENEAEVKEFIGSHTVAQIKDKFYRGWHDSGMKKSELIDSSYEQMVTEFGFIASDSGTLSISGIGKQARFNSIKQKFEGLSNEQFRDNMKKRKAETDNAISERKKRIEGMSNPQTLEDFRNAVRNGLSNDFTPEQWAQYDRLHADERLAEQAQRETKQISAVDGEVNYELHETTHSKKGHELFIVSLADRVDRDLYTELNTKAKQLGGYYSAYNKQGAIPGFQFRTDDARNEFLKVLEGESVEKTKVSKDKTASLEELADRIEERANESLSVDRKTNTAKRSREAGYAIANAEGELAKAAELKAIAKAIKDGTAKYITKLSSGTERDLLTSLWNGLRHNADKEFVETRYEGGMAGGLKWKEGVTSEQKVRFAEYPLTRMYPDMVKRVASKMADTKGYTMAGKKLLADAEAEMKKQKDSRTRMYIANHKHFSKFREFIKANAENAYYEDVAKDFNRLQRMGITSTPMLRAALLEYDAITRGAQPTNTNNKVKKQIELSKFQGKYKENDFFNSTPIVTKKVIELADIEEGMSVFEPSAGVGSLADAAAEIVGKDNVDTNELAHGLREYLTEQGYRPTSADFLTMQPSTSFTFGDIFETKDGVRGIMRGSSRDRVRLVDEDGNSVGPTRYYTRSELTGVEKRGVNSGYDRIIMNPPFSKGQEARHVAHAYRFLKPGGRLVAVTSSMAGERSNKVDKQFREWLDEIGADETPLPEGAFKEAINSTNVNTKTIVIDKPKNADADIEPPLFSLNAGTVTGNTNTRTVSRSNANEIVSRFVKGLTSAGKNYVSVVSSYDDLPTDIKDAAKAQGVEYQVKGVFHKGKVHVVLDQHTSALDMETTLFHEAYGHLGIKNLFGDDITKKLNSLFIANGGLKGLRETAKRHGISLEKYIKGLDKTNMPQEMKNRVLMDELLAHLQQSNKPSVKRLAREIVGFIRQKLRDLGLASLAKVSDSDLFYVLKQARAAARNGKASDGNAMLRTANDSPSSDLDMSDKARMQRARDMGFDTDTVYYHGTKSSFESFSKKTFNTNEDRGDYLGEAFYFSPSPEMASDYATWGEGEGANLVPAYLKMESPLIIDGFNDYLKQLEEKGVSYLELRGMSNAEKAEKIKSLGYDGLIDNQYGQVAVFEPNQIRSVNAAFDPREEESGNIMFRTTDDAAPFTMPEESWTDNALRFIQDKFNRVKRAQDTIRKAGIDISDSADVYGVESLYYGKVEEDFRQLAEKYLEPMAEKMAKHNIKQEELDLFLYALHAPERNAHIHSMDEEMTAGSGMTDDEARRILDAVNRDPRRRIYNELQQSVREMIDERTQQMFEQGLIDEETFSGFQDNYQYYVPLKGQAKDEGGKPKGTGMGFNIKGKESIAALGRKSRAESPLLHAYLDTQKAITRGHKNEVGNALLNLIEEAPNPELWSAYTTEGPLERKKGPDGKIKMVPMSKEKMSALSSNPQSEWFATKRDGMEYYIKIDDPVLAMQMKNVGVDNGNRITQALGTVNRFLSMMATSANPEFLITNVTRDVQTALYNLAAESDVDDGKLKGVDVKALTKNVLRDMPKALAGIRRALRENRTDTEWSQIFDDFRKAGAKTGYFDMKDIETQSKDLQQMMKLQSKPGLIKYGKAALKFIEDYNSAVENTIRVSVYKNAIDAGISRHQAAVVAKNLTVNFNRKGQAGTWLNSLYLFANAGIQGTANFARAIGTFKTVNGERKLNLAQKAGIAMAGIGFSMALMNRFIAGEDDDGESYWDKVPEYVKERNFVLMLPGSNEYVTFPMPYGYNIFANFGTAAESIISGGEISENAGFLTKAAMGSFLPIGLSEGGDALETGVKTIMPQIGKPFIDLATNSNFFGSAIYSEANENYGSKKSDAGSGFKSTNEFYKQVAMVLNEATGGSEYQSGLIDVHPETVRYMLEYIGSGASRFVLNTSETIARGTQGEFEPARTPFVRRFYGETTDHGDSNTFYERLDEVETLQAELESLKGKARLDFRKENKDKLRLVSDAKRTQKKLKLLRKRLDHFKEKEDKERQEKVEAQIETEIDRFNLKYNEIND